ncbi:hypothetical protein D8S78_16630 [Natrialba swarupiae]|nr:hypothetical protein [Natrialba swarupiae]
MRCDITLVETQFEHYARPYSSPTGSILLEAPVGLSDVHDRSNSRSGGAVDPWSGPGSERGGASSECGGPSPERGA